MTDTPEPTTPPDRTRRRLVVGGAVGAATVGTGGVLVPAAASGAAADRRRHADALRRNPFTLGVASGDPVPDGVVLWFGSTDHRHGPH